MEDQDIQNISEVIESKDFSRFIGFKEDLRFEVKGKNPYNFDSPVDRYELAKDVSAFANVKGGYIIIGLKHKEIDEKITSEVKELDLIKKEDFSISQYKGIIKEYIYPPIKNIKIDWIEDKNNNGYGIGYIFIPDQDENKKYFLIKKVIEEKQSLKQIVFGLVQRVDSSNVVLSVEQLYQKLQQGKSSMSERLTRIENKIDLFNEKMPPVSVFPIKSIKERLEEKIKEMNLFNE